MLYFRGIPDGRPAVQFINRKGWNSLNVLVTGGFSGKIHDLVINVPGSFHDAAAYGMSAMKAYLESSFLRQVCLGDSAFALSDVLITPFSQNVARNDRRKTFFY